jgi:hypothetical protein
VTPDTGAAPGGLSPADGCGPRGLLAYRSAQGRRVVAAMILGSSVAGIDSTVVAVALPAIGRNLPASLAIIEATFQPGDRTWAPWREDLPVLLAYVLSFVGCRTAPKERYPA